MHDDGVLVGSVTRFTNARPRACVLFFGAPNRAEIVAMAAGAPRGDR
jgi:hypothetical protein